MARFDKLEFDDDEETATGHSTPEQANVEKDERYWLDMAETQRRSGNHENALRFYSRSLEFDKSLIIAWVGQVQMLILLGEYPQPASFLAGIRSSLSDLAVAEQAASANTTLGKNQLVEGAKRYAATSTFWMGSSQQRKRLGC